MQKKMLADIAGVGMAVLLGGKYSLPVWVKGVAVIQKKTPKAIKSLY